MLTSLRNSDDLFEWLYWPPNVFALTSLVLQRTGCYRICLIEDVEWDYAHRNEIIDKEALNWIEQVGGQLSEPTQPFRPFGYHRLSENGIFETAFLLLQSQLDFPLIHLRIIVSDPVENFAESYQETAIMARAVAKALVDIHSLADLACGAMGIVDANYCSKSDVNLAKTIANFLLTATGSLSTIDKIDGVVLPKFRTPQQGQALRSLSHHLTFHATETEIVWRTTPWLNTNDKTLNILAVPMPYKVGNQDFSIVPEKNHPHRYFRVKIEEFSQGRIQLIHAVVDKLVELRSRISRVHLLVFPELSLTKLE